VPVNPGESISSGERRLPREPCEDRHRGRRTCPPDAPKADIQLQILGLLRIWHRDVELDAGPRQQAYLLALLLARAGRPLSVDSLIDLI